jgi:23S rRNA (cytidine1920-2'-O)/16S rRNA (cytidine1409-2'-O)-methyltransferase
MNKKRIDVLLVEKNLAPSRERAQSLLLSGQVLVNDVPITKAGQLVLVDSEIRLKNNDHGYVSRSALKLKAMFETLNLPNNFFKNQTGLDVGASTGGFTQLLLEYQCQKVFALDVGTNQLDWKIRSDPRVVSLEKTNARAVSFETIGTKVDVIVMDVSFISIQKIAPNIRQFSKSGTRWFTLIKPQFEVGREKVGRGGIVSSLADREEAVKKITEHLLSLGLELDLLLESPLKGTDGNQETIAAWTDKKE